jgi:tRNA threonylcarbamoyladenosine biosynthesis protein TsaE
MNAIMIMPMPFMSLIATPNPQLLCTLDLSNEAATQALGAALAPCVQPGFTLHLQGDLGAGKTTLTRALLRTLGVTGTLRSPTFALLEPYELPQLDSMQGGTLHHFDFYRMENDPLAWRGAGFEVAFEAPHAAIVEWPQYAQGLPVPQVRVNLQHAADSRIAHIELNYIDAALLKRLHSLGANT